MAGPGVRSERRPGPVSAFIPRAAARLRAGRAPRRAPSQGSASYPCVPCARLARAEEVRMPRRQRLLRALLCLSVLAALGLCAGAPSAFAQNTGSVTGTIVDSSDQVIPGAMVSLVDERTGILRAEPTDSRGVFTFNAVRAGSYTLKVELPGFRTLERRGNVLNASGQLALGNLRLEVGALTEML